MHDVIWSEHVRLLVQYGLYNSNVLQVYQLSLPKTQLHDLSFTPPHPTSKSKCL